MKTYRVISRHAEDLAGGRLGEPGGFVELSDAEVSDPHNKRLIDEGKLIPVKVSKEEEKA